MSYEDTIRVAALKTRGDALRARPRRSARRQPARCSRSTSTCIRACRRSARPCRPASAAGSSGRAGRAAWSSASPSKGRVVTTSSLGGFLLLYAVAGLRRWRRATAALRAEDAAHRGLAGARSPRVAAIDPALAVEVAQCQRLVKGYGDTHERGCATSTSLMAARAASAGAGARAGHPARAARRRARRRARPRAARGAGAARAGLTTRACETMSTAPRPVPLPRRPRRRSARWSQPDRVHRDLYIDPELFELEQEHFFANTWNYVGHDSQVPNAGRLHHAPRSPASR